MSAEIHHHVGDLLSVKQGILVHGCNALGVMGAGVALAIRKRYPECYERYRKQHITAGLSLGELVLYEVPNEGAPELIIANAITQQNVGTEQRQVDYEAVDRCFESVAKLARERHLEDIHFPLIGCGLAGGDWGVIEPIIAERLEGLRAHLWVLK